MAKKGLGRGLDALLSDNSTDFQNENNDENYVTLRVSLLEPAECQARKRFDHVQLAELAQSISLHGIIQPLIVRKKDNGFYEIIAGERRWRACKMAGITEVPAIIREVDDSVAAEISLIENLQRQDLNPVEEALGYKALIDTYGLTQEEAASKVGKSRTAVANILRILKLPEKVLALVEDGSLTYGHARALLPLTDSYEEDFTLEQATYIVKNDMSVRETESYIKVLLAGPKAEKKVDPVKKSYYKLLERNASASMGRIVSIKNSADGKGTLRLAYNNADDLEKLLKELCGNDFFDSLNLK